MKLALL